MSEALERNQAESARLSKLVAGLETSELSLIVHDNWTVAAKLAHIAYWDRFALAVLERWAARKPFRIDIPDWYDDLLNDAVLIESLAVEPTVAARLAVEAAAAMDRRLLGLGPEQARLEADAAIPETDANWLLHRYRHRGEHLDEIEAALRGGG